MNVKRLRIVVASILTLTPLLIGLPFFTGKEDDDSLHLFTVFCVILMTIIGLVVANTWCKRK